jgi:hypothetical protein
MNDLDLVIRRASIAPSSIDIEARTAEVVWSTGARVLRSPWFGDRFYEELSLDPKHVRLERLTSGRAPLLDAHNGSDTRAVVGVVETARLQNGEGTARVRFAKDDEHADQIWNKVQQRILQNISVGYRVHKLEKVRDGEGEIPVMRATDWEPFEISIVPMGADAGATFRAAHLPLHEEPTMPIEIPTPAETERERTAEILRVVRLARLDQALAEELIASGASTEQARRVVLDRLVREQERQGGPRPGPSGVGVETGGGSVEEFRAAATDGLLLRAGIALAKPHAAARDFTSTSIHEIARTCLSRSGIRHTGMSSERLIERAMTTSDFPEILKDGIGKAIRRGYETEPSSHRAWVRTVGVRDFKDQLRPILGSAPDLEQVLEHGEYPEGSLTEDSTSYRIAKYGRIVALTWETLVNDDLGAFLRVQPALGAAARRKEADTVYALFALNAGAGPTMQDNTALFHSNHANLTSAGSLDAALLGAGRTLLRKQTAVGGGYLALTPRFLIVPPDHEDATERLIAAAGRLVVDSAANVVTQWIGGLELVVEPRLASGAIYLAAGSEQIDTFELGLLGENEDGPTIIEDREFVIDIIRWKVRHVFGAKALDWRGLVKMPISG